MSSPPGLRSYLKAANEAETESLRDHDNFLSYVERLDALFRKLMTGKSHFEHPAASLLSMQSHANFLAGVSTAIRGQSPQTYMILRGCIESAMYAYLISLDEADGDVWMKRRENPEAVKARFSANRAIQILGPRDPHLAAMAKDTYQSMIEMGAHPNPRSVMEHIRPQPEDETGNLPIRMIYLHDPHSSAALRALSGCVENACLAIALVSHSTPKHPDGHAVFDENWVIFHEFQKFLSDEGYITILPEESMP